MDLFFVVVLILAIIRLIKEACEKPAPKGQRFDWDAYWKDIEDGIDIEEQLKRRKRGYYLTTEPINDLVDIERYEHDKDVYGEDVANKWKVYGYYRYKQPNVK